MLRRNDAWDHWYDDLEVSASKLQQVKCKFCPLTIAYRADRMLAHLGYRSPQGSVRDVSICKMVPHLAKQLFEKCGGTVLTLPNAILKSINNVCTEEEVKELEPVLSQCRIIASTAYRESLQSSQSTNPSLREVDETPMRELCQHSLPKGFNASTKEILDKVWALAFYEANIPFNVVRHPTFIHTVWETIRLQMPAYTPPSYNAVHTRLLIAKRIDAEKKVEEKLGNFIGKYGVTIYCDGWDNVRNRLLLKDVQCGTNGDFFLGTINTTRNHKDHQYVASQIPPFLEKVGVHNVVQVCTDNALLMTAASCHILHSTSHLYVQGCSTHCLDLLLEDWEDDTSM